MNELFAQLSGMIMAGSTAALTAALIWGILSVILSPCHLASIPLVIGFINNQKSPSTLRAFVLSLLFSTGILLTIVIIGVGTGLAGRMLGDIGSWGNFVVAAVFILVGLNLTNILSFDFKSLHNTTKFKQGSMLSAFMLGLIFGLALGPCTFAYIAPMVAIALTKATPAYALLLFTSYGIGHCGIIAVAGTSSRLVQNYLNWNENTKIAIIIKQICGALVITAGIYIAYLGIKH